MTIEVTSSRVQYVGDGIQTVFPYNFRIFQDDNLNIYLDGVLQVIVTDYTMTNSGDESGGDVTMVLPPDVNAILAIDRVLEYKQLLDLIEFDRFPAESVEAAMDYMLLLVQQNKDAISRSIGLPSGSPLETLEFPIAGAGEFIKYTDDGLSLETADITKIDPTIVPTATDAEIIAGTETQIRVMSPVQSKLAVTTHETDPVTSVFDSQFHQVVNSLPPVTDPNVIYLVRE